MAVSKETVEYLAHLARIELKNNELEKFSLQLENILDFIDKLKEIDIEHIPPTSHILALKNVLRQDTAGVCLPKDKALENAPQKQGDFFGVPKIIE